MVGPNHYFAHYFVGAGARYLNWVAATPGEWRIESWTARGDMADALKEFEGWHPQVSAIIESADATNRWALYDRDSLSRWTVGRVTLMGDAAHAMLPYMAQGAVQSIEDAAVLAKCLERGDARYRCRAPAVRADADAAHIAMPEGIAPQRRHVPSGRRRRSTKPGR
jgi:salicylate hydroxylase